jgi:hypothetical protein
MKYSWKHLQFEGCLRLREGIAGLHGQRPSVVRDGEGRRLATSMRAVGLHILLLAAHDAWRCAWARGLLLSHGPNGLGNKLYVLRLGIFGAPTLPKQHDWPFTTSPLKTISRRLYLYFHGQFTIVSLWSYRDRITGS